MVCPSAVNTSKNTSSRVYREWHHLRYHHRTQRTHTRIHTYTNTDNTPVKMTMSGATEDTSCDTISSDALTEQKSTTRAGRTNTVRETVARFPASDSSPSPKNGARCWREGHRAGVAGIAKPLLTSLPQPQHNLFPEQPRSLYEEETGGCLWAVGCGDIKNMHLRTDDQTWI